jgi:hypothetical protein
MNINNRLFAYPVLSEKKMIIINQCLTLIMNKLCKVSIV